MKFYRVVGAAARISPGEEVLISNPQARRRAHLLTVLKDENGALLVSPNEGIDFKVGEVVGLKSGPPKAYVDRFEEVGAKEAGAAWKKAVETEEARLAGARKAGEDRRRTIADGEAKRKLAAEKAAAPKPVEAKK